MCIRTIILLFGAVISFKIFADPTKESKPTDTGFIESQWITHLNNKSTWQERQGAVNNWKAVAQFNPEAVVSHLQSSMLSDRSKKVRETAVTALIEMAEDSSYSTFKPEIVKTLTESVFNQSGAKAQNQRLSDSAASQITSLVAKVGFSNSDYKVRKNTIDLLVEIAELYPDFKFEIAALIGKRKEKETSHTMKVAIRRAIKKLTGTKELQNSACIENFG